MSIRRCGSGTYRTSEGVSRSVTDTAVGILEVEHEYPREDRLRNHADSDGDGRTPLRKTVGGSVVDEHVDPRGGGAYAKDRQNHRHGDSYKMSGSRNYSCALIASPEAERDPKTTNKRLSIVNSASSASVGLNGVAVAAIVEQNGIAPTTPSASSGG